MSPEETILSWFQETIDHEIWCGDSFPDSFTASKIEQYTNPDYLELSTTLGVFRLKIERKT